MKLRLFGNSEKSSVHNILSIKESGRCMKILVTGAYGQLGKGIRRYWASDKDDIFLLPKQQLDITNIDNLHHIIDEAKPDAVINCAAKTNVDELETLRNEAYAVNGHGAGNVAQVCNAIGAKLVHISTDYVFDGKGIRDNDIIRPYVEGDLEHPLTVYGQSKYDGELRVSGANERTFILRTAWLFGSGKRFVGHLLQKAKDERVVTVVNDQYGSATSVKELTQLIEKLIDTDNYGLYHATCEGVCTWYDVASFIFERAGIDIPIQPCSSSDMSYLAPRPMYSVLENKKLKESGCHQFSDWRKAMAEYVDDEVRRLL